MWVIVVGVCTVSVAAAETGVRSADAVVLPLVCVGSSDQRCAEIRQMMVRALSDESELRMVADELVDQAVRKVCGPASAWWSCFGQDSMLFELGKRLRANIVVAGKVAGMGNTQVLRVQMANCATQTVATEFVEAQGDTDKVFLARFLLLHQRLHPQPQEVKAWYQRWESWTIAGAMVALITTGLVIGLSNGDGGPGTNWEHTLTLP